MADDGELYGVRSAAPLPLRAAVTVTEYTVYCPRCGQAFSNDEAMLQHLSSHYG